MDIAKLKKIVTIALIIIVAFCAVYLFLFDDTAVEDPGVSDPDVITDIDTGVQDGAPASVPGNPGKPEQKPQHKDYSFRNSSLLNQHYDKHGKDMGFKSAKAYEAAANEVISNPEALCKTESEDGDYVYYVVETNEFVVVSTDGYIRTYFLPDSGKKYYDKQ